MDRELIVPVDGSSTSWRAFDVALALAERFGNAVSVLEVACDPVDGRYTALTRNASPAIASKFGVFSTGCPL